MFPRPRIIAPLAARPPTTTTTTPCSAPWASLCASCRLRARLHGWKGLRARGVAGFALTDAKRGEGVRVWATVARRGGLESRVALPLRSLGTGVVFRREMRGDGIAFLKEKSGDGIRVGRRDDGGEAMLPLDEGELKERIEGEWEFEDGGEGEEEEYTIGQQEYMTTADLNADQALLDDIRRGQMSYALEAQDQAATAEQTDETDELDTFQSSYFRTHPLTAANRFSTDPSTLPLPQTTLIQPIDTLLSDLSPKHLTEAAHTIFGGVGLPYSAATPGFARTLQQKPIALDASRSRMSEMEADVFLATLLPSMYASAMSVLTETRKRLGTKWAEGLVVKAAKGQLRILDVGGAGAGVLAVREMLRAEWERMHEDSQDGVALAEADGRVGAAGASPPLGSATVLIGSDALRHRVSRILENTTFVPRLPDYSHAEEAKKKGKFDLILASHTLWPIREDYLRKPHVENLWNLLSTDGGVLVLLEKGIARGFEIVAAAREMLLEHHVASPGSRERPDRLGEIRFEDDEAPLAKEVGAIIAPCTNHEACPMYKPTGLLKGRRDICHFSQRYLRTRIQQRILGAKEKNFEDIKFSYLAVQRGRDLRAESGVVQDRDATDAAFAGYGHPASSADVTADIPSADCMTPDDGISDRPPSSPPIHSLALPRTVLPALKRRGHVILDLCTPSGTLERWTVPRSFSRHAYRDARKSEWGDLWALGAKTRIARVPSVKTRRPDEESSEIPVGPRPIAKGTRKRAGQVVDVSVDPSAGLMRGAKVVKGLRDKRDKKADGRGRRKGRMMLDRDQEGEEGL